MITPYEIPGMPFSISDKKQVTERHIKRYRIKSDRIGQKTEQNKKNTERQDCRKRGS
jgi:hypothetical protein